MENPIKMGWFGGVKHPYCWKHPFGGRWSRSQKHLPPLFRSLRRFCLTVWSPDGIPRISKRNVSAQAVRWPGTREDLLEECVLWPGCSDNLHVPGSILWGYVFPWKGKRISRQICITRKGRYTVPKASPMLRHLYSGTGSCYLDESRSLFISIYTYLQLYVMCMPIRYTVI